MVGMCMCVTADKYKMPGICYCYYSLAHEAVFLLSPSHAVQALHEIHSHLRNWAILRAGSVVTA